MIAGNLDVSAILHNYTTHLINVNSGFVVKYDSPTEIGRRENTRSPPLWDSATVARENILYGGLICLRKTLDIAKKYSEYASDSKRKVRLI